MGQKCDKHVKKTMNPIKKKLYLGQLLQLCRCLSIFIAMYVGGEHKAHVVLVGNKKRTIKKN